MFTGFSNIFKNLNKCQKICKNVTMATQGSHHEALQNLSISFTVVSVLFVCIFIQKYLNVLKLVYMKGHFYFDMFVKYDKFLNK